LPEGVAAGRVVTFVFQSMRDAVSQSMRLRVSRHRATLNKSLARFASHPAAGRAPSRELIQRCHRGRSTPAANRMSSREADRLFSTGTPPEPCATDVLDSPGPHWARSQPCSSSVAARCIHRQTERWWPLRPRERSGSTRPWCNRHRSSSTHRHRRPAMNGFPRRPSSVRFGLRAFGNGATVGFGCLAVGCAHPVTITAGCLRAMNSAMAA
jgi:hypothetical protein